MKIENAVKEKTIIESFYEELNDHKDSKSINLADVREVCESIYAYAKTKELELKEIAIDLLKEEWGESANIEFMENQAIATCADGRRVCVFKLT
jgi:hypothetical protein